MRASFLSDAKAKFLLERGSGGRSPWFGKEAVLRPRDALVASRGYVFVSADYSQVQFLLLDSCRYDLTQQDICWECHGSGHLS